MRCKICNVDVSENTKKCPLCGAVTVEEEPVIKGIKTAYYPKVEYKKPKPNFNLIFGIVWLIVSAGMFIIDMLSNNGDITLTLFVATALLCIWSFVLRPIYTDMYYFGRFVMADTIFLSLWLIVFSAKVYLSVLPAFSYMIPAVLALAILVVLFNALFVKKNAFRAPIFAIMLGVLALIIGVICIFVSGVKFYVYSIPFALAVFSLTLLWVLNPEKVKEELKARFHA